MKMGYTRSISVTLLVVTSLLLTPLLALAQDEVVTGLGGGSYGWTEFRDDDLHSYNHLSWQQLPWPYYNSCNGETRAAAGDVDGGGLKETVYGLGPCSYGWFEIRDDASNSYNHVTWINVPWTDYNNRNGETWPAAGNLDSDSNDEIVLGLGNTGYGWFEVRNDSTGGYGHLAWLNVPWPYYNNINGETRPAVGDIDGGGEGEIVVGLGTGSYGWFEVRDGAAGGYAHITWLQVPWTYYNNNFGGTRPALGDIDGDGRDEIVVGLDNGSYGWYAIFDDATTGYAFIGWYNIDWSYYSNSYGETRPSVGNVDGGACEEIVIGLGTGSYGWYKVVEDACTGIGHRAWVNANWPYYNSINGETWPAVGDSTAAVTAAAAQGTETTEVKVLGPEPAASAPKLIAASMEGPPLDQVNASATNGPTLDSTYYAGPTAVDADSALAPSSSAYYAGPPLSDTYYPGPQEVEMEHKLFLPFAMAE